MIVLMKSMSSQYTPCCVLVHTAYSTLQRHTNTTVHVKMHRTQKQNKKQSGLKALLVIHVDLLTC